jgi:alkylated DNA repair dioxygenase AlkB
MLKLPEGFLYIPRFFSSEEAQMLFERFENELAWKHQSIQIFGKEVMQPRLTAWYADAGLHYTYSGRKHEPEPWHPALLELRHRLSASFNIPLNSVLANYYRQGSDSMGWHSDDEPELGKEPGIVSVSLGEKRRFLIRRRQDFKSKWEISAEHGSVLFMNGRSQHDYQHAIPKEARVKAARINLTFRYIQS